MNSYIESNFEVNIREKLSTRSRPSWELSVILTIWTAGGSGGAKDPNIKKKVRSQRFPRNVICERACLSGLSA